MKNIAKPVGAYRVLLESRVTDGQVGKGLRAKGKRRRDWNRFRPSGGGGGHWRGGPSGSLFAAPSLLPFVRWKRPTLKKMALPFRKPSIAVLPFVNMSDDPKQEFFSDGITEKIITALSKITAPLRDCPELHVPARANAVKIKQVSEELGVRYALEGSVRRTDDRVRITAQLIDALNGSPVLSERFDGKAVDVFALQDEITLRVLTAVKVKLAGPGRDQGGRIAIKGRRASIAI